MHFLGFLDHLNVMLTIGMNPALFAEEEKEEIVAGVIRCLVQQYFFQSFS